jgi:aryl-alcohol dehydrogenase-like predicted oxidoreductase
MRIAQELSQHVASRGGSLIHFAVQWVLNNQALTSVIAGPRTFEQWTNYTDYNAYQWSAADEALVEKLVVTGHASTHGFVDPQYPIDGRFPAVKP